MEYLLLLLLGLGVGAFGTLIGAGGGFILMPVLLLIYPGKSPATLTAMSLAVVCFNASSGSWSYARMKRVDFRSGLLFLLTGIPGAVAGAYLVRYIPRHVFNLVFGVVLLAGGAFIFYRSYHPVPQKHGPRAKFRREMIDAGGHKHVWTYDLALGMTLSFVVGLASSILGIGGGIIHVPAMVSLLNFPVHVATATSQFILAVMAFAGTVVHLLDGSLELEAAPGVLALAIGAVIGAQVGAQLSKHVHGRWILRSLAMALSLVGLRILILVFWR